MTNGNMNRSNQIDILIIFDQRGINIQILHWIIADNHKYPNKSSQYPY